jgi:hypothetical protein
MRDPGVIISTALLQRLERVDVAEWLTWFACALAVLSALAVLLVPLGGTNRVVGAAVPFAVGAVALAGNSLTWRRSLWVGAGFFALGGLAIVYAIVLALSVPLRLAVQGTCPLQMSPCPLGFDHPLTGSEGFAVYTVTIFGLIALVLVFAAIEIRHVHRRRPGRERTGPTV